MSYAETGPRMSTKVVREALLYQPTGLAIRTSMVVLLGFFIVVHGVERAEDFFLHVVPLLV